MDIISSFTSNLRPILYLIGCVLIMVGITIRLFGKEDGGRKCILEGLTLAFIATPSPDFSAIQ